MKKTDYIANIAHADGKNALIRRVWENDQGRMYIKVDNTFRTVRSYNVSSEYRCTLTYKP